MDDILGKAREVAEQAALAAAKLAKEYFHLEKEITEKDEHGDLVTTVDHLAEAEILRRIRESFPEHLIRSEEGGWSLPQKVKPSDEEDSEYFSGTPKPFGVEGDWLWLVDPLDGTNNYALLYNSEGDDLYAGILLARQAGAAVIDFGGNDFDCMITEPYLIACHPSQTGYYLSIVKEAIL